MNWVLTESWGSRMELFPADFEETETAGSLRLLNLLNRNVTPRKNPERNLPSFLSRLNSKEVQNNAPVMARNYENTASFLCE